MTRRFTETELRGATPIWILDLRYAGRVFRFATEAVEIDNDGQFLPYIGTLTNVTFGEQIEWLSMGSDLPSADLAVVFREDVARLVQQGHDLSSATGELALWVKGGDYDDRRIVVSGRVTVAQYGELGEPVLCSLEANWFNTAVNYPPATAVIDDTTWPDAHENTHGKAYPTIIGKPQSSPVYIVGVYPSYKPAMVAGHRVLAQEVTIRDSDTGGSLVLPITHVTDELGRTVATVDLHTYSSTDQTFWCEWTDDGGLANPYKPTGYLTSIGDVLRWSLRLSQLTVDTGRTITAMSKLDGFSINGFIGETVDILEWIKQELLALVPVSLVATTEGIYPIVWDRSADSIASVVAGRDWHRASPVAYEDNDISNELTMKWAYSAQATDFVKRTVFTGDEAVPVTENVSRNAYTVASHIRHGGRAVTMDSVLINDTASASRVLAWKAQASAFKHRIVQYRASTQWAWVELGAVIEMTDEAISLSNQRVLVTEIQWGETELIFTVLLIPDSPRDTIIL